MLIYNVHHNGQVIADDDQVILKSASVLVRYLPFYAVSPRDSHYDSQGEGKERVQGGKYVCFYMNVY